MSSVCEGGGNGCQVSNGVCPGLPKEPEGEEEWFCPVCKVGKASFSLRKPCGVVMVYRTLTVAQRDLDPQI